MAAVHSFEHMVMLFGLQVMLEGKYTSFTRHKKTLQHIIDTTCTLGDRHQALLVRVRAPLPRNHHLPPWTDDDNNGI